MDGEPADPFMAMVDRALAAIPEPFAAQLRSVAIVIEDWPSRDQLRSVHAHGLYGLYQGVPRTQPFADSVPVPSRITIFRGSLERDFRDAAALEAAVFDTVRHEVAHHLGISDERLAELSRDRSSSSAGATQGSRRAR